MSTSARVSLIPILSLSLAVGLLSGCSPSPDEEAENPTATTTAAKETGKAASQTGGKTDPEETGVSKELLDARKKAVSNDAPPAASPESGLDALLNKAKDLKLTPEQQARLKELNRESEERLRKLAEQAQAARKQAEAAAAETNRDATATLQQVRKELAEAAQAGKQLAAEKEKIWNDALKTLNPQQRDAAKDLPEGG